MGHKKLKGNFQMKNSDIFLISIIQFNLIFKHGKIWAERKRYEWRKERNTAT